MILDDIAFIEIKGAKSRIFLQSLTTQNVNKDHSYHLILTPQGRFLFDFFLHHKGEDLLLEVNKKFIEDLTKKLTLYNLRNEVEIHPNSCSSITPYKDPRSDRLGMRGTPMPNLKIYHQKRAHLGFPDGAYDLIQTNSLPIEYGFEKLNAFDWEKGCFIGQEISRKMHHLENLKKILIRVTSATKIKEPQGQIIQNEKGEKIGKITSTQAYENEKGFFYFALIKKTALNKKDHLLINQLKIGIY